MSRSHHDGVAAVVVRQARNNCWCNLRLLDACAKLSEEQYFAARQSFFGSIHATLVHIMIVDELYLARLHSRSPGADDIDETVATFGALRDRQEAVDRSLLAFCEEQDDASLFNRVQFSRIDGQQYDERIVDVLMHVFLHQVHHRGQVHDMLAQTDVQPPQLDEFFMAGDLDLRRDELARLAFSVE